MEVATTFEVLGPLRVTTRDGRDVTPTGALQRRLLAMLLLRSGAVVSADRLVDVVWGSEPGERSPAALHSQVSRLRRRIPGIRLDHEANGYRLVLDADTVDAARFESAVSQACSGPPGETATKLDLLDDALRAWRGQPYPDLDDTDEGLIEIQRLGEIHTRAVEERLGALLVAGRASESIADLEALVAREPLRERPRILLMDALSAVGRRAEALRVYDAYRLTLAAELGVSPSPEIRARHDELLALDDAPASGPAVSGDAPDAVPATALPARPISTLVGRDAEVRAIAARIAEVRLLTLVGPGGVGKTRLALEVAHRVAGDFDAGVVFCDLSVVPPAASGAEVAEAVGSALRVEPRAGTHPADRLAEVLRHDRALVVLDNCEHVLDGAAEVVERLLGATDMVTVLATGRERLAADGETLFAIAPLDCSGAAGRSVAVELFADRARAVGVEVTPDDEPMIDELCRRLDGLPLALELAATRLSSLTLDEIRDGLDRSLTVLRGGRRAVSRHRSLEAALEWSYRLLDATDRDTLAAAATFVAPFDALDVASLIGRGEDVARERLASLVEKSLVLRADDKFALLDTVRGFVREVTDPTSREGLRRRHARHLTARVVTASQRLRMAEDDEPIALVRRLVPDLRQAFATVIDEGDAETALNLVVGCRDLAMDAMLPELLGWGEPAAELGAAADLPLTVDALGIAAMGWWKMGDLEAMGDLLRRAVDEAGRLGVPDRYEVLGALGTEDLAHGDLARAIERLERSIATPEARDDVHRLAEGGATLVICQAYAHARGAGVDAERLVADVAGRAGVVPRSWCWYAAGECVLDSDPDLARDRLTQAVELARRGGAAFVEGVAGASLASLAVREGRHRDAVDHYRWLLPHWLRAGVSAPLWTMLRSVVELLVAVGDDRSAASLLGAVTAPWSGHEVVGDDDLRLRVATETLRERIGADELGRRVEAGRALDAAGAAAEAAAAFDRMT